MAIRGFASAWEPRYTPTVTDELPSKPDVAPRPDLEDAVVPPGFWAKVGAGFVVTAVVSALLLVLLGGKSASQPSGILALPVGGWLILRGIRSRSLAPSLGGLALVGIGILLLAGAFPGCTGDCTGAGG